MPPSEPTGAIRVAAHVLAFDGGSFVPSHAMVAVEAPVQVTFARVPFAVMMMTPSDLDDFAYGFSLTEGVVERVQEVRSVEIEPGPDGTLLHVEVVGSRLHAHLARRRMLAARTSCGLCGIEDLAALPRAERPKGEARAVSPRAVARALAGLEAGQHLNHATHAVHGAAWADEAGDILHVREDVGRHNALDKLIGAAMRAGVAPERGFVVVTSRASFEMVEKVAAFGARTLVAISAPTSLALERARSLDLTLIAVARRDSMTVFHGAERLCMEDVS
jgi:FdhD protein